MILWFYLLWSFAILRVLLTPFRHVVRTSIWGTVILAGIWLIIGALTYQTQYASYSVKRIEFEAQKKELYNEKSKLESLYQSHPTAIDLLTRLTYLSYQLGEHEQVLRYIHEIERVDPNSPAVEKLRSNLQ